MCRALHRTVALQNSSSANENGVALGIALEREVALNGYKSCVIEDPDDSETSGHDLMRRSRGDGASRSFDHNRLGIFDLDFGYPSNLAIVKYFVGEFLRKE